jgi:hypothetical protein
MADASSSPLGSSDGAEMPPQPPADLYSRRHVADTLADAVDPNFVVLTAGAGDVSSAVYSSISGIGSAFHAAAHAVGSGVSTVFDAANVAGIVQGVGDAVVGAVQFVGGVAAALVDS